MNHPGADVARLSSLLLHSDDDPAAELIVVERGVGLQNACRTSTLGELRQNSNMGKGQMVTSDFVLTPSVVFSENNAGGVGGAVAGMFGHRSVSAVAGGLKFKEAQTSMLLADARSGVQVAAAEGSTKKADIPRGAPAEWGRALGGYGNTTGEDHRRTVDNYNNVGAVRGDEPASQRRIVSAGSGAGGKNAGGACSQSDVLVLKIANVRCRTARGRAKVVATLGRADELVVL
jgi:hypothetical protein